MSALPNIVGIILAAGESSRMGAVKQTLPFNGKTILQWVIDNAIASSLQRVVVVIGHRVDLIEPMLEGKDITVVINSDYQTGQSSSLKAGLRSLTGETEAVLFLLGDQPLVESETINSILSGYVTSKSPIVLPMFNGKRGNPVLFSRETFSTLESLSGDCGARTLFQEYAGKILEVPVDDPNIHFDLDTEDDYRRLLELESE